MTNVRRYFEGGYYFFTVCTYQRKRVLTQPHVLAALRDAIRATRKTHPFSIDAWVVLPDHLHCLLYIPDKNVPVRWRKIKALTTRALPEFASSNYGDHYTEKSRSKRQLGKLWQKGYWEHTIRDERDLMMYTLYCCFNPVKHGYVKNALHWPHSTLHKGLATGKYPNEWRYINAAWVSHNLRDYDPR